MKIRCGGSLPPLAIPPEAVLKYRNVGIRAILGGNWLRIAMQVWR